MELGHAEARKEKASEQQHRDGAMYMCLGLRITVKN